MFDCAALAFPAHNIQWKFINSTGYIMDITATNGSKYQVNTSSTSTTFGQLTVTNVQFEDRGTYNCTAINAIGFQSAGATLTVHGM